jgi:hypothetical protein
MPDLVARGLTQVNVVGGAASALGRGQVRLWQQSDWTAADSAI